MSEPESKIRRTQGSLERILREIASRKNPDESSVQKVVWLKDPREISAQLLCYFKDSNENYIQFCYLFKSQQLVAFPQEESNISVPREVDTQIKRKFPGAKPQKHPNPEYRSWTIPEKEIMKYS